MKILSFLTVLLTFSSVMGAEQHGKEDGPSTSGKGYTLRNTTRHLNPVTLAEQLKKPTPGIAKKTRSPAQDHTASAVSTGTQVPALEKPFEEPAAPSTRSFLTSEQHELPPLPTVFFDSSYQEKTSTPQTAPAPAPKQPMSALFGKFRAWEENPQMNPSPLSATSNPGQDQSIDPLQGIIVLNQPCYSKNLFDRWTNYQLENILNTWASQQQLSSVTFINLFSNHLNHIPDAFRTLKNLAHLNIGNNPIEQVFPNWLLDELPLTFLNISNTKISGVMRSTQNRSLEGIRIEAEKTGITEVHFDRTGHLVTLHMKYTPLRALTVPPLSNGAVELNTLMLEDLTPVLDAFVAPFYTTMWATFEENYLWVQGPATESPMTHKKAYALLAQRHHNITDPLGPSLRKAKALAVLQKNNPQQ